VFKRGTGRLSAHMSWPLIYLVLYRQEKMSRTSENKK